ncbi:MSHA biogenesis protein MshP [Pseudidiomarina planktonica]|uniref:MSHA biogenesis protein MshP n=1 Tax=Pseudidiomarina planktonica TaxID=1323738 RepID=A0A1Y6ED58_9GAMM|nr:pilus assembly PilX N-terminal domain-containing protein [Pseudidiomarina planktonica]RUO66115.1 type II secretory pathway component [Pseudidiomarina planktonica]SMQ60349.1 MSHA biogenesis protein MshP [Pseudidiomarina planktonica]
MFNNYSCKNRNKQRGSALTIAIFVIVVMGLLGIAIIRLLGGSSAGVIAEVSGSRALAAANAGVDLYLTELFPLDETAPYDAGANPSACPGTSLGGSAEFTQDFASHTQTTGLQNCEVEVQCRQLDLGNGQTHFRLEATGICTVGGDVYSRQLQLEASDASL